MRMARVLSLLTATGLFFTAVTAGAQAPPPPAYGPAITLEQAKKWGSVEIAKGKAHTAVAFRRPTKVFQDAIGQGGANLRLLNLSGVSLLEGGIPIVVDGKIIGTVGVSGVTSQQDAQIGQAGIEALLKK